MKAEDMFLHSFFECGGYLKLGLVKIEHSSKQPIFKYEIWIQKTVSSSYRYETSFETLSDALEFAIRVESGRIEVD